MRISPRLMAGFYITQERHRWRYGAMPLIFIVVVSNKSSKKGEGTDQGRCP